MNGDGELLLGIDGGGTKTVAALAEVDSPEIVIGRAQTGPSNLRIVGRDQAIQNLDAAIDGAFADVGLERRTVDAACFGLAGVDREDERRVIEQWAQNRCCANRWKIVHDAVPVLYAGSPDGTGVAVISGTGSLAFGRHESGSSARSGGWGPVFGDEGSGYAIATAALRAAAKAVDGRGQRNELLPRLMEALVLTEPSQLISAIYDPSMTRERVAELATVVFEANATGDDVAAKIIRQAADDLAEMVVSVLNSLEWAGESFPLALTGGVLLNQIELREILIRKITERGRIPAPVTCVADPVLGAIQHAHELTL